jgi:hypothetical protein
MNNFSLITKVDVSTLVRSLEINEELWDQCTLRTYYIGSAHSEANDIVIRYPSLKQSSLEIFNDLECEWFPASFEIPVKEHIYGLMQLVLGDRVGRCCITRLKPGCEIFPHIDEGIPSKYYQRFHICLKNSDGSIFKCEDEIFTPTVGDVYIVANHKIHSVENNTTEDRLTLIIDIRTPLFEHIKETR